MCPTSGRLTGCPDIQLMNFISFLLIQCLNAPFVTFREFWMYGMGVGLAPNPIPYITQTLCQLFFSSNASIPHLGHSKILGCMAKANPIPYIPMSTVLLIQCLNTSSPPYWKAPSRFISLWEAIRSNQSSIYTPPIRPSSIGVHPHHIEPPLPIPPRSQMQAPNPPRSQMQAPNWHCCDLSSSLFVPIC